jgi:hypothetical protein
MQRYKTVSNKFENISGFYQLRNTDIYDINFCSEKFSTFHWIRDYNEPIKIKTEFVTQLLLDSTKTKFNWGPQNDLGHKTSLNNDIL